MKRLIAVLIILVMCLSLAACSEEKAIVGTWRMDVTAIGEDVPQGEHYAHLTFAEDGAYTQALYAGSDHPDISMGEYILSDSELTIYVQKDHKLAAKHIYPQYHPMVYDIEIKGDEMIFTSNGVTQVLERVDS